MKSSRGIVRWRLLNKCGIKITVKAMKVRFFGATWISVPFPGNITVSLKRSQHNVTSSKTCVLDQVWQNVVTSSKSCVLDQPWTKCIELDDKRLHFSSVWTAFTLVFFLHIFAPLLLRNTFYRYGINLTLSKNKPDFPM